MSEKKKFEACLLRTEKNEFIVALWDQLVTAANKCKLRIGSTVGFKKSAKTREKVIRGTIVIIGKLSVCEQQQKLLTSKTKTKKTSTATFDDKMDSECESDSQFENNSSVSNGENSFESNEGYLHIDSEEEDKNDHIPMPIQVQHRDVASNVMQDQQMNVCSKENENINKSAAAPQTNTDQRQEKNKQADDSCRNDCESFDEKIICEPTQRKYVSSSSYDELKLENTRLKKQVEIFKKEWMPRPTEPAVIRYFTRVTEILETSMDVKESRGDRLADICTELNMSEQQLRRLQKDNGTKTARSIVRAFYPKTVRSNILIDKIDDSFRQAVHDYVQLFHGMEFLSQGKINESINNVFRSARSQQRREAQ